MILRKLIYPAATIDVVRKLDICHEDCSKCFHLRKSNGYSYCDAVDIICLENPFCDKDKFDATPISGSLETINYEPLKIFDDE